MGTNELYECEQIKNIKKILEFLEELWKELEIVPKNIVLNSTRSMPSITIELESLVPLKHLVKPNTIIDEGQHDIWMHSPKFVNENLNKDVTISFHWYKPESKVARPFQDVIENLS